jgi:beta-lactamase class A
MLILSVGVGVLAGTLLSAWNPATNPFLNNLANQSVKQASSTGKPAQATPANAPLSLAQELTSMKTAVQTVVQQHPGFTPGVFLIDLDTNNFMDLSGSTSFPAASTIKVPVLIAFFQDVDAGKIRLDEKLTMRKELVATEAGDMQYLPVGSQFTALETATKMITISDNTATNMLIDRLGGIQAVNQRFKSWGLAATQITNLLPDLKGTNTTSPKELADLMVRVSQGELVSLRSRDRLLDIMSRTVNNSQLPQGLGEGATIAHKTGDISVVIGDVGLIDMPSGKRYATAVMIRRQPNDDQAYDVVQKISRAMYQNLINPANPKQTAVPAPTASPQPSPAAGAATPDAP